MDDVVDAREPFDGLGTQKTMGIRNDANSHGRAVGGLYRMPPLAKRLPIVPRGGRFPLADSRVRLCYGAAREMNLRSIGHAFADGAGGPGRRGFIALAGSAAAWTTLGARAQALPVIGYL